MTQGKGFTLLFLHLLLLHHLSVDFRHGARGNLDGEALRPRLAELAPPFQKQNSPEFLRGCLKLLYAYLIGSLIGSRPLEASA
jgi:hypothetical protein